MQQHFQISFIFILFYFICHTIITKNMGKEEKKKWRGDLTETIGAYERLGLLELRAKNCLTSIEEKMMERSMNCFAEQQSIKGLSPSNCNWGRLRTRLRH